MEPASSRNEQQHWVVYRENPTEYYKFQPQPRVYEYRDTGSSFQQTLTSNPIDNRTSLTSLESTDLAALPLDASPFVPLEPIRSITTTSSRSESTRGSREEGYGSSANILPRDSHGQLPDRTPVHSQSSTSNESTVEPCRSREDRHPLEKARDDIGAGCPEKKMPKRLTAVSELWRSFNSWWWWEIYGITVAICGFVASAILLGTAHGKPLSSWVFPLAPNSLLSVLVTISKTALLLTVSGCISQLKWHYFQHTSHGINEIQSFDDASRGPWGSFTFLLGTKPRNLLTKPGSGAPLAVLGTVITIASLGLDSFAQQILSFPLGPTTLTSAASLPMSQVLDSGDVIQLIGGTCNKTQPLISMIQNPDCDLLEPYPALGFGNAVLTGLYQLNSSEINYSCSTGNCTWPIFTTLGVCRECNNVTSVHTECHPTTGDNEECTFITPHNLHLTNNVSVSRQTLTTGGGLGWGNSTRPATLAYVAATTGGQEGDIRNPIISECSVYFCARTINSSVVNGRLSENFLSETPLREIQAADPHPFNWTDGRFQTFEEAPEHPDASGQQNRTYRVNTADMISLANIITGIFLTSPELPIGWEGDLWATGDLLQTVEHIAISVTNSMRQLPNNTVVEGEAVLTEPYIEVHWAWGTFLAGVFGLGLALLVATVVLSSRRRGSIQLWKASTAALIFSEVRNVDRAGLRLANPRELEDASRRVKAQLNWENARGLEFLAEQPLLGRGSEK